MSRDNNVHLIGVIKATVSLKTIWHSRNQLELTQRERGLLLALGVLLSEKPHDYMAKLSTLSVAEIDRIMETERYYEGGIWEVEFVQINNRDALGAWLSHFIGSLSSIETNALDWDTVSKEDQLEQLWVLYNTLNNGDPKTVGVSIPFEFGGSCASKTDYLALAKRFGIDAFERIDFDVLSSEAYWERDDYNFAVKMFINQAKAILKANHYEQL